MLSAKYKGKKTKSTRFYFAGKIGLTGFMMGEVSPSLQPASGLPLPPLRGRETVDEGEKTCEASF